MTDRWLRPFLIRSGAADDKGLFAVEGVAHVARTFGASVSG
jgi:hypothetical protein